VKELSAESAAGVMEKLRARFAQTRPAGVGDEGFQFEDKYLGRLCFFRKGSYIGGYANVMEGKDPVELSKTFAGKLP